MPCASLPPAANSILPEALAEQVQGMVGQLQAALQLQGDSLQGLWSTLFWVAIGLSCCLALHASIR
jgi:hypothetical protein